jgi:ferredoxin
MSRFGIRKRLRSALGMGRRPVEIVRYPITYVLPDGSEQTVQAEEHYSVLMASQALPAPIGTGRRAGGTCPDGGCALCRVEILDTSGLSPMTDFEQASMQALADGKPHEGRARKAGPKPTPTSRLACHTKIVGPGARVQVLELFDYDSVRGDPEGT